MKKVVKKTTKPLVTRVVKPAAKKTVKKVTKPAVKKVVKASVKKSPASIVTQTALKKSPAKKVVKALPNTIDEAQAEASVLLTHAQNLTRASTSKDDMEKVAALDANLQLWVEIETALKSTSNLLPREVKANLLNLSKFVERLTISKGLKMTPRDYDCLVNINMQISEGLLESVKNQMAREEAFSLLKCAIDLSHTHSHGTEKEFATALDNNLKLWVYIKTAAQDKNNPLPKQTKANLVKLAEYVSGKTIEMGKNLKKINEKILNSMILTNLQISEGLMTFKGA